MCGRKYNKEYLSWDVYRDLFGFKGPAPTNLAPNYNIAPTHEVPVVAATDGSSFIKPMRWGLIPSWSKELKMKFSTFNARAEKLEESRLYSPALRIRRCIVPVSGFFEWKRTTPKSKQVYAIQRKDDQPLLLAGLWAINKQIFNNKDVLSYTVITRKPNSLVSDIHNRMPAILLRNQISAWLNSEWGEARECLAEPFPSDMITAFKVSNDVGNVRNNYPDLVLPKQ